MQHYKEDRKDGPLHDNNANPVRHLLGPDRQHWRIAVKPTALNRGDPTSIGVLGGIRKKKVRQWRSKSQARCLYQKIPSVGQNKWPNCKHLEKIVSEVQAAYGSEGAGSEEPSAATAGRALRDEL